MWSCVYGQCGGRAECCEEGERKGWRRSNAPPKPLPHRCRLSGCCGLEAQGRSCDCCDCGESWKITEVSSQEPGSPPYPAFLEASGATLGGTGTVLSWPQFTGILLFLPLDSPSPSTVNTLEKRTNWGSGFMFLRPGCGSLWGRAFRPMGGAMENVVGGV